MPASEARSSILLALAGELGAAPCAKPDRSRFELSAPTIKSWTKDGNSPVSEADIAVDNFLRERLRRDGFGWLSEESQDDRARLNAERLFIVDPIDGTRSYLAGLADWSIVAAVVEKGRPVAAAVYVPVDDALYLAAAGSRRDPQRRDRSRRRRARRSRKRASPVRRRFLDRLSAIDPATIHEPKIHSLALRMTRVAEGRIDAAFASVNAYDWDLAAADLLVHEAGGVMTNLAGELLVYNLHDPVHGAVLAAGRARHAAMLDLVRNRRKEFA